MSQTISESDFINAAKRLDAPVWAVRAVAEVESNGSGFLADGRVKVQFEPHVMYQRLKERFDQARADRELAAHPDLVARKAGSYQSLDREDKDMNRAATIIDRACALESASWGAFQIMGYHWQTLGFGTLQEFINKQYSAAGQLDCFVRFILADSRLVRALQQSEWATFARIYNGPGYQKNNYDTKLANAAKRYRGA